MDFYSPDNQPEDSLTQEKNSMGTMPVGPISLLSDNHFLHNSLPDSSGVVGKSVSKKRLSQNLIGLILKNETSEITHSGEQSVAYFEQFSGKKIASVRLVRLHPFGTSLQDTLQTAQKWYEKAGNHLHMNTAKTKLRMQLLFHPGDSVDPLLMAENEKLMRDLDYLEDVFFRLDPVGEGSNEVNVVVLTKDRFEYAFDMSATTSHSDLKLINENMFGFGHRLNLGMAQQNSVLPEMGFYFSYSVNNILGKFINSSFGYSDTYLKKGWYLTAERKFLTSKEKNAGGFFIEHLSKYNHLNEDHPIELDTSIAYRTYDLWFQHAFSPIGNRQHKTILAFRYLDQLFQRSQDDYFGNSPFIRDHQFLLTSLSHSKRNLYKNNQIYGYGVTEDIPYGHLYELTTGLDHSQFGNWPYLGISLNNSFIDREGRYYNARFALDGFLDQDQIRQGSLLISANFFSNKFIAWDDPCRFFLKMEILSGINRFREEYLKIDGRFGIRDFYTHSLKGENRLKLNFEIVRYLRFNLHNFKFTNYLFADFAFLSTKLHSLLADNFYAGIGTGFRIYNESLVFKIIDARISWFPHRPPEGIPPFGTNLQGLSKARFDDFMGKKPQLIRYQ